MTPTAPHAYSCVTASTRSSRNDSSTTHLILFLKWQLALGALGQGFLGGADEVPEERVRAGRAGAELGVELDADEEGMVLAAP